jgi:hypothetical protein
MANHCKIIPGYQAWTGVLDINSTGDGQSFAINAYLKNGSTPDSGCFFAPITKKCGSFQPPVDVDYLSGSGFAGDVIDFNALNNILKDLGSQFRNISIRADDRVDLSPLHSLCEKSNLLQYIRV